MLGLHKHHEVHVSYDAGCGMFRMLGPRRKAQPTGVRQVVQDLRRVQQRQADLVAEGMKTWIVSVAVVAGCGEWMASDKYPVSGVPFSLLLWISTLAEMNITFFGRVSCFLFVRRILRRGSLCDM